MIINFKIFESEDKLSKVKDLTYDDLIELNKLDRGIKEYFMKKYPMENIKILGRYGHSLSDAALYRLSKFAIKKNDKILSDLIQNYFDTYKEFVDDPEIFRNKIKYNI